MQTEAATTQEAVVQTEPSTTQEPVVQTEALTTQELVVQTAAATTQEPAVQTEAPTTEEAVVQKSDKCASGLRKCDANANCINTTDGFICECKKGFEGDGFICAGISTTFRF